MLLRTVFLLALLVVVGETIVHGAGALAQAALHRRALDAARAALVTGVRAAQSQVAQTLASTPGVTSFAAPAPIATCAYADAGGCELSAATVFTTPTPAALGAPQACPQTDCTIEMQGNTAVTEGRATFLISTTISAPGGATLATRSGMAAFRTYATPPYASLVGGVDASIDALMTGGAGDDAGSPSSLITVQYAPSGGGAGVSANVWKPVTETQATAAPAWEP